MIRSMRRGVPGCERSSSASIVHYAAFRRRVYGVEGSLLATAISVGRSSVEKVHELDLNGFSATHLLPELDPRLLERHPEWVVPGTYDGEGHALLSVHTWLIRHDGQVILVDTGAGNDKERPGLKEHAQPRAAGVGWRAAGRRELHTSHPRPCRSRGLEHLTFEW